MRACSSGLARSKPALNCLTQTVNKTFLKCKNLTEHIYFLFEKLSVVSWNPISILCEQYFRNVQLRNDHSQDLDETSMVEKMWM